MGIAFFGDRDTAMKRPDVADTAYWTAYDYHMIERDARAERRALAYAAIANIARGLYQLASRGLRQARSTVITSNGQRWTSSS